MEASGLQRRTGPERGSERQCPPGSRGRWKNPGAAGPRAQGADAGGGRAEPVLRWRESCGPGHARRGARPIYTLGPNCGERGRGTRAGRLCLGAARPNCSHLARPRRPGGARRREGLRPRSVAAPAEAPAGAGSPPASLPRPPWARPAGPGCTSPVERSPRLPRPARPGSARPSGGRGAGRGRHDRRRRCAQGSDRRQSCPRGPSPLALPSPPHLAQSPLSTPPSLLSTFLSPRVHLLSLFSFVRSLHTSRSISCLSPSFFLPAPLLSLSSAPAMLPFPSPFRLLVPSTTRGGLTPPSPGSLSLCLALLLHMHF